jgi:hypothetical protein
MKTHRRHARRKNHGVFLGDADIKITVGIAFSKCFMPVPVGIAAVMPTMELSFLAELDHRLAHHVLIMRAACRACSRAFRR